MLSSISIKNKDTEVVHGKEKISVKAERIEIGRNQLMQEIKAEIDKR